MKKIKGHGFTLVEVLISIVIVIVLAATVLVGLDPSTRLAQTRNSTRYQEIESVLDAILEYQVDNDGDLPTGLGTSLQVLGTDLSGCDITCGAAVSSFIDNDQTDFDAGSYSSTQYDIFNSWLELTAAGQSGGSGTFTSQVFDAGDTATWDAISWNPLRPYRKELVDSQGSESGYTGGGTISMSGNQLLLHMNESSWNGTSGEVLDYSSNENNGTAQGDATTTTSGRFNSAGTFDGTGDYILIPDDPTLEFSTALTVAGWFYFTSDIGTNILVEKGSGTNSNVEYILYTYDNGDSGYNDAVFFDISATGTSPAIVVGTDLSLSGLTDQWVYIAAVYTGTTLSLYVNNSLVDSDTGVYSLYNGSGDLGIGSNEVGDEPFGPGRIDELAMWNRALSLTELNNFYRRGVLNLRFQVRSCDDALCSGETFIGPDTTSATYYTEENDNGSGSPYFALAGVSDNQYFQYQALFGTENSIYTPELYSVSITSDEAPVFPSSACLDLSSDLVDNYLSNIPYDDSTGDSGNTSYAARVTSGGRINVMACTPELGQSVSVQR